MTQLDTQFLGVIRAKICTIEKPEIYRVRVVVVVFRLLATFLFSESIHLVTTSDKKAK